jgi:GTPase Era involved in 16S rRNA processing
MILADTPGLSTKDSPQSNLPADTPGLSTEDGPKSTIFADTPGPSTEDSPQSTLLRKCFNAGVESIKLLFKLH